jgi:tyrosine-protein phosphatase SIW14
MTGPLNETLVPPLNFALVAPGVYRSGYPNKRNIPFLTRLGLKTIVYLCPEEISPETQDLIKRLNIQYHHLSMQGNKEPFTQMDQQTILKAIEIILNTDNHPVLVHCNKGKHRVGCVMGIIRKLQNWSTTAIFDEYRRFSGTKARIADQEFIEIFNGPVRYLEEKKPSWL